MASLYIDLGNTRAKAYDPRVRQIQDIDSFELSKYQRIWIASVRQQSINLEWAEKLGKERCVFIQNTPLANFNSRYQKLEQLGVDRWLTALAVADQSHYQGVLVVDAGTAVKLEWVNKGWHEGGYILPGYDLWRQSLNQKTDRIDAAPTTPSLSLGVNTSECVGHSFWLALKGAISELKAEHKNIAIVWTGGYGKELSGLLNHGDYIPDLLFRGMEQVEALYEMGLLNLGRSECGLLCCGEFADLK